MKRLTNLLNLNNDDALFSYVHSTFRNTITTWDYYVNWKNVFNNISYIEQELNILNYLIGKKNIEIETAGLIKKYPSVIKAFPILVACRDKSFEVLIDVKNFIDYKYDFSITSPTEKNALDLASFVLKSGLADILENKKVKNLVDYVIGVEVGLGSNGRKNRIGTTMEEIVEVFVNDYCHKHKAQFLAQATASKIFAKWGIQIKVDKSSRIIDFAINKDGRLFLMEVNFYGGGGSKLKSTATEYCEMYSRYNQQGIDFIWVTDGAGWHSTLKPLREYFDKSDYLVNLEMLRTGILSKIIV